MTKKPTTKKPTTRKPTTRDDPQDTAGNMPLEQVAEGDAEGHGKRHPAPASDEGDDTEGNSTKFK